MNNFTPHLLAQKILKQSGIFLREELRISQSPQDQMQAVAHALYSFETVLEKFPEWEPNTLNINGKPDWINVFEKWFWLSDDTPPVDLEWPEMSEDLLEISNRWKARLIKAGGNPKEGTMVEWPFMALIKEGKFQVDKKWSVPYRDKMMSVVHQVTFVKSYGILKSIVDHPDCLPAPEVENHGHPSINENLLTHFINDSKIREILVNFGFNPNGCADSNFGIPLFKANTPEAIDFLKENSANLGKRNKEGFLFEAQKLSSYCSSETDLINNFNLVAHWKNLTLNEFQEFENQSILACLKKSYISRAQKLGLDKILKEGQSIFFEGKKWGCLGATIQGALENGSPWNSFDLFLSSKHTHSSILSHQTHDIPDIIGLLFLSFMPRLVPSNTFQQKLSRSLKRWEPNSEKRIEALFQSLNKMFEIEKKGDKPQFGFEMALSGLLKIKRLNSIPCLENFSLEKIDKNLFKNTLQNLVHLMQDFEEHDAGKKEYLKNILTYLPDSLTQESVIEYAPELSFLSIYGNTLVKTKTHNTWAGYLELFMNESLLLDFDSLNASTQKFIKEKNPSLVSFWEKQNLTKALNGPDPEKNSIKNKMRI